MKIEEKDKQPSKRTRGREFKFIQVRMPEKKNHP